MSGSGEIDFEALQRLFDAARALPPEEREAFVRAQTDDAALRDEALSLLSMDGAGAPEILEPGYLLEREFRERAPTPSAIPNIPGFDVQRVLGDGGMGRVYLAQQHAPNRPVALKVLRMRATSTSMRARFAIEAESLARLGHPGIASIYASGGFAADDAADQAPREPYSAMEYVRGLNIIRHASTHDLSTSERLELFLLVVDAVQHAHQKGVIHRDLKPANILVGEDGQPKVLDFGIARLADGERARLTVEREEVLGTLEYMSPEQLLGSSSDVTASSDVYSLGVLLFELLTGRLPHDLHDVSIATAAMRISSETTHKLREVAPSLPSDLEIIVAKALSQDVEMRYASAAYFADDLRRFLANEPVLARKPSAMYQLRKFARRKRGVFVASLIALVAVVVGAALTLRFALQAQEELRRADRAESGRLASHVRNLLSANADSVAVLLGDDSFDRSELLEALGAARARTPLQTLRIACARAALDAGDVPKLLDVVPQAPAAEARNVEAALQRLGDAARAGVRARAAASAATEADGDEAFRAHVRYALLAFSFGDDTALRVLLEDRPDPSTRSATIFEAKRWTVAWEALASTLEGAVRGVLDEGRDAFFLSGVLACFGSVDPARLDSELLDRIQESLRTCYLRCGDARVHHTITWCGRRLGIDLPEAPRQPEADPKHDWFVHENGQGFVRIPAGGAQLSNGLVQVSHDLWIGDREITTGQFREYLRDRVAEDPNGPWRERLAKLPAGDQLPVLATWHEAIAYCDWRSQKDGLEAVYAEGLLELDAPARLARRGYRLLTAAELEYALRAGTTTDWIAGRSARYMLDHAQLSGAVGVAGTALPNRFGAFDLAGNLWDMCSDRHWHGLWIDPRDPVGILRGTRCQAGGGPADGGTFSASSRRFAALSKSQKNGFRLAYAAGPRATIRASVQKAPRMALDGSIDDTLDFELRGVDAQELALDFEWRSASSCSADLRTAPKLLQSREHLRVQLRMSRAASSLDDATRSPSSLVVFAQPVGSPSLRRMHAVVPVNPVLAKPEHAPSKLRILVWNLASWTNTGDDKSLEILRFLHKVDADLVVLNSADRGTSRSGGVDLMQRCRALGMHMRFRAMTTFEGGLYGKLFLARAPFRIQALDNRKRLERIVVNDPSGPLVLAHLRGEANTTLPRAFVRAALTRAPQNSAIEIFLQSDNSKNVDYTRVIPPAYREVWSTHGKGPAETLRDMNAGPRGPLVRRGEFAFVHQGCPWRPSSARVRETPTGSHALLLELERRP